MQLEHGRCPLARQSNVASAYDDDDDDDDDGGGGGGNGSGLEVTALIGIRCADK